MNTLSLELLQNLNKGHSIVAELPASDQSLRKWIEIFPYEERGGTRYGVRMYELKKEWIEKEQDVDGYELNKVREDVDDLPAALAVADAWLPGPVEWQCWADSDTIV